jgi:uncharacterized membrane protein
MDPNQVPPSAPSANKNSGIALLSYLGILIIVPLISPSKDDPFVKFHVKQGLVLIILWIVASMLAAVPVIGLFSMFVYLGCFILMILGIMNAASGKMKELPFVGHLAMHFNF